MSQDAGAAQSKRHVYGPMVFQFPGDGEAENAKSGSQSFKLSDHPVAILIVLLLVGGSILYFKGNGLDVGQLNLRGSFTDGQMLTGAYDGRRKSLVSSQARVAADRLYLREGPGMIYVATYLLPENWRVSLIGDYETDDYGEVWARVLVQTNEGLQEGWVSRRYLQ
ncbi:MAG TPA: SH3 domain-containing protein [Blastocatellia bacterium]